MGYTLRDVEGISRTRDVVVSEMEDEWRDVEASEGPMEELDDCRASAEEIRMQTRLLRAWLQQLSSLVG